MNLGIASGNRNGSPTLGNMPFPKRLFLSKLVKLWDQFLKSQMLNTSIRPKVLLSSSGDLKELRRDLRDRLARGLRGLSVGLFLWEEETENGLNIEPGSPIQQQINELLLPGVTATVVMFGERIGEPLSGKPLEETADLLALWEVKGLRHPWPVEDAEKQAFLDDGCFPLTGTVYELLVALQQNEARGNPLFIGYLSDKEIDERTRLDQLKLNNERWFTQDAEGAVGSAARESWSREVYDPQRQGVVNLIRALTAAGTYPRRYDSELSLARQAAGLIERKLRTFFEGEVSGSGFKKDLSHFSVSDALPFPDREDLRTKLVDLFKSAKAARAVLTLSGKSGCGKSSLLQKGLLGSDGLALDNALPLAIRPTDISAREGRSPLQKLCHILADFFEENNILAPGVRDPQAGTISGRIDALVKAVTHALETNNRVLLLGIDQFEEILDFAKADCESQQDKPESWWHVLHFIGRAAQENNYIWVAATLESQRRGYPEEMDLAARTGIELDDVDVEFNPGDVRQFLERTASERGVQLAPDVIRYVDTMVRNYLEGKKGQHTSSFLPLLALWMHRFYTKFDDWKHRAKAEAQRDAPSLRNNYIGRSRPITMADLTRREATQTLDEMVPELVADAWIEAGFLEVERERFKITDTDAFNGIIRTVSQSGSSGAQLVKQCFGKQPQNPHLFCQVLLESGRSEIPGIEIIPKPQPHATNLDLFFSALVGVDNKGNMQLKDMPVHSHLSGIRKLITAHIDRRLLEPVASTGRVRLVHQAIVDNWEPARLWFEKAKASLAIEADLEVEAHRAGSDVDYAEHAAEWTHLEKVAQVLTKNRGKWTGNGLKDLSPEELSFRRYCLGVLSAARTGGIQVNCDPLDELIVPVAYVAAMFDLVEPITRWVRKPFWLERGLRLALGLPPLLIDYKSASRSTMLSRAAWSSPGVVKLLIQAGAKNDPDDKGWYPISSSIQTGQAPAIDALYGFYEKPETVVGPNGITMLHVAASSLIPAALRYLLPKATDLNVPDDNGDPPLLFAIIEGQVENSRMLIEAGADCLAESGLQRTALHWVAQSDSDEIAELIFSKLSDSEKRQLIFEPVGAKDQEVSAIQFAALLAAPQVLRVLLKYAEGAPIDEHGHPLIYALRAGEGQASVLLKDRVSKCVQLILDYPAELSPAVLQQALGVAETGQPDAFRLIVNHIVLRHEDLSGFPLELVLNFALERRLILAQSALDKRQGLLDSVLENGDRVDLRFLKGASVEALQYCLAQKIEPAFEAELFRLGAALRICREGLIDNPVASDQPDAESRFRELFPGADPGRLHPIIQNILEDHTTPSNQTLLGLTMGTQTRSLLHRLAVKNELKLYEAVVDGISDPLPRDLYGRLPSEVAAPVHREAFEAVESSKRSQRNH